MGMTTSGRDRRNPEPERCPDSANTIPSSENITTIPSTYIDARPKARQREPASLAPKMPTVMPIMG